MFDNTTCNKQDYLVLLIDCLLMALDAHIHSHQRNTYTVPTVIGIALVVQSGGPKWCSSSERAMSESPSASGLNGKGPRRDQYQVQKYGKNIY